MRLLKCIASGAALLLLTAPPLLADGFTFYDFECEKMGLVRTKTQLVHSGRDPTVGEDIVFSCEGRTCVQREFWDDGSGNTGVRARFVHFPRGQTEMVSVSASWRDGEDTAYHQVTYVDSLLPCGF